MWVTIGNFCRDETGSVTTDWVVLSAGLLVVAVVFAMSVFGGAMELSLDVGNTISAINPG